MSQHTRLLGYCTNVHPGSDLASTRDNLLRHAVAVRARLGLDGPLGIGLWLSNATSRELAEDDSADEFGDWLETHSLVPYTLNGFPFGDFHSHVVKHDVYQPNWLERDRMEYTIRLIQVLDRILPAGMSGTISTLPIAWGALTFEQQRGAAAALATAAQHLADLEEAKGRHILLCLEPEPGCFLQRSYDVIDFFQQHLDHVGDQQLNRRYLAVCHDVCHANVMWESQISSLENYRRAQLPIAKIQVSSHVQLTLDESMTEGQRNEALMRLEDFAESRYLHQTCVAVDGDTPIFFEDLPGALRSVQRDSRRQEWRVHFHVPIHLDALGPLQTGQRNITDCLESLGPLGELPHIEVETYAWDVLPTDLRPADLAAGIAQEIRWLGDQMDQFCNSFEND